MRWCFPLTLLVLVGCANSPVTQKSFSYIAPQEGRGFRFQPLYGKSDDWTEMPLAGTWVEEGDYYLEGCVLLMDSDQPKTRVHIAGGHTYIVSCDPKDDWKAILNPAPYDGETTYLTGPLSAINQLPFPTTKEMIGGKEVEMTEVGVTLGWFDEVQILEVKGDQIKFARPIVRHSPNLGWAPASAFRKDSDFVSLKSWPTPGTYRYCSKDEGCYSLQIHADATFYVQQSASNPDACELADVGKSGSKCEASGQVYAAPGYFKLQSTNFGDFLVDLGGGKVCRVGYWNDSFTCDPSSVTFSPN